MWWGQYIFKRLCNEIGIQLNNLSRSDFMTSAVFLRRRNRFREILDSLSVSNGFAQSSSIAEPRPKSRKTKLWTRSNLGLHNGLWRQILLHFPSKGNEAKSDVINLYGLSSSSTIEQQTYPSRTLQNSRTLNPHNGFDPTLL